jgi:enoyl-CoA hydratase/carnithine racemase
MAYEKLRYEVADGVATIALDHPETRNALSDAMLDELLAAFARARDDDRVRCVVLASTHEKVFSSGGDLGGFTADIPLVQRHAANERFPRLFELMGRLGKPIVCAAGSASRSPATSSSRASARRSARRRSTSASSRS